MFFLFFFVLTLCLKWGYCLNTSAVVCDPGFLPYVEVKDIGRCVEDTQTEAECQQAAIENSIMYFGSLHNVPTKSSLPFGCLTSPSGGIYAFNPYRSSLNCSSEAPCVCKPTSCTPCPEGAYCPNSTSKILCPVGKYSNTISSTNASTCKSCLVGKTALDKGSISCSPCPKGAYCPNSTSKILCPVGKYSNTISSTNASTCKSCLVGKTALDKGSISCSPCPKGAYCPNSTSKILCTAGKYSNTISSTNASTCKSCLVGKTALDKGSISCSPCPKGAYCPNSTSKILCTAGKYGGIIEATTEPHGCSGTCEIGKYGFAGASHCASCSFGKYGENGTCFKCRHDCLRKSSESFGPQQIVTTNAYYAQS
eukprot:g4912.t1